MAITFYATNNFTGDGTTVNWNINFADGYIDTTNVKARYLDNTGSYVDIAISSVAGNVVTISPAVANGQEFQIYRDTEKRFPLVDFSDGAILNETNLDTLATQAVMVSAEAFDQSNNGVRIAGDSLVIAQGIDAKAQTALDNSVAAVATADGIAGTANTALSNSQTALTTANAANTTANGIAATANQALTNSNTAISTANAATATANSAEATANAIDGKATTAINTANSAVTTANSASTKADTAIATANGIDGKAQDALDTAAAAQSTADSALSGANAANTGLTTKAAKGANSDITSLSGLTTALSVAQGGTGASTAAQARSNLGLGSVATLSNVPITSGGTGAVDAAGARTNLGLGTSATMNTGTNSGNVLTVGDFGIGRPDGALVFNTTSQDTLLASLGGYGLSVFRNNQQIPAPWDIWNYSSNLFFKAGDTYSMISIPFEAAGKIKVFGGADGQGWKTSRTVYDTVNTTVDSNGFIKAASPIVKVFHDGSFETNEQSTGVSVKKISTGVYLISGCLGLNSDAVWGGVDGGFEIPIDRNKQPRVWLDYTVKEDGSILVKTYHRTHPTSPAFARNELEGFSDGDPIDIPKDAFVSVRVEMPDE